MDDDDEEVYDDVVGDEYSEKLDKSTGFVTPSVLRQLFCVSTVVLLPFHFSAYNSMMPPVWPTFEEHQSIFDKVTVFVLYFGLSPTTSSLIVHYFLSAAIVWLAGRKRVVVICNFSYLFLATFGYFYLTDFKSGFFVTVYKTFLSKCVNMIHNMYIMEIADSTFRLCYLGLHEAVSNTGSMVVSHYRQSLFVWCMVVAGCTSLFSIIIPESPFWSASKGDTEAAERNFWWIRANNASPANVAEFDSLLDAAQQRREDGPLKAVFSRTFAVCCTFVVLILICNMEPCDLQLVVSHDFYFPENETKEAAEDARVFYTILYSLTRRFQLMFLGIFVFSALSFVVPRKIIFLSVYVMKILLIVPMLLKLADPVSLGNIGTLCHLITYSGMRQLAYIIPLEIFPASSREFGCATASSLHLLLREVYIYSSKKHRPYFRFDSPALIPSQYVYISIMVSIVGLPYLMLFMPETMGRSVYDLRELKLFTFGRENVDERVEENVDKRVEENVDERVEENVDERVEENVDEEG